MRERVCAAVLRDDTVLMVQHQHDGRTYWTLPGGAIEPGEQPSQAALRELHEETGLVGTVIRLLYVRAEIDGENDSERCFLVAVPADHQPVLGSDPELPGDAQMLTALAWHPLADLHADRQGALLLAELGRHA